MLPIGLNYPLPYSPFFAATRLNFCFCSACWELYFAIIQFFTRPILNAAYAFSACRTSTLTIRILKGTMLLRTYEEFGSPCSLRVVAATANCHSAWNKASQLGRIACVPGGAR